MSAHSPLSTASRNARSLHRFVSLDSAWALLWILLTAFLGYVATTSFLSGGLVLPAQPINSMGVACGSESGALSQPYLFFAPTSTMTALQTVCVSSCPNTEADMLTCNATHVALSSSSATCPQGNMINVTGYPTSVMLQHCIPTAEALSTVGLNFTSSVQAVLQYRVCCCVQRLCPRALPSRPGEFASFLPPVNHRR
jgi:hypothetical protein